MTSLALILTLTGAPTHCCGGPVFIGPYVLPYAGPAWWWTTYYPPGSSPPAAAYGNAGYAPGYASGGYSWYGAAATQPTSGVAGQGSWPSANYYYGSAAGAAPGMAYPAAPPGAAAYPPGQAPSAYTVTVQDGRFEPENITVPVGAVVTWINRSGRTHTVTSDRPELFDSRDLEPGQEVQFRFNQPGTYTYHCQYEGYKGMVGTVTVGAGIPPTTRPAAPAPGMANPPAPPRTAPPAPPARGRFSEYGFDQSQPPTRPAAPPARRSTTAPPPATEPPPGVNDRTAEPSGTTERPATRPTRRAPLAPAGSDQDSGQ